MSHCMFSTVTQITVASPWLDLLTFLSVICHQKILLEFHRLEFPDWNAKINAFRTHHRANIWLITQDELLLREKPWTQMRHMICRISYAFLICNLKKCDGDTWCLQYLWSDLTWRGNRSAWRRASEKIVQYETYDLFVPMIDRTVVWKFNWTFSGWLNP